MPIIIPRPEYPKIKAGCSFRAVGRVWKTDRRKSGVWWYCSDYMTGGERGTFSEDEIQRGLSNFDHTRFALVDFLATKEVGDLLHYRYGQPKDGEKPRYIRGRIEVENDRAYFMPIAVVGDWPEDWLPAYQEDGRLYQGSEGVSHVTLRQRWALERGDRYYEIDLTGEDPSNWPEVSLEPKDNRDPEFMHLRSVAEKFQTMMMPKPATKGMFGGMFDRTEEIPFEIMMHLAMNNKETLRTWLEAMRGALNELDNPEFRFDRPKDRPRGFHMVRTGQ